MLNQWSTTIRIFLFLGAFTYVVLGNIVNDVASYLASGVNICDIQHPSLKLYSQC